jgi:segregation and condensation protein B
MSDDHEPAPRVSWAPLTEGVRDDSASGDTEPRLDTSGREEPHSGNGVRYGAHAQAGRLSSPWVGNGHGPAWRGIATAVQAAPGDVERSEIEVRNAIECLLLVRGGPVRLAELRKVLEIGEDEIRATLAALQVEYAGRGLQIQEVAGGYQLCTRPAYGPYVQRFLRLGELEPLTRATLEVLAIVAYRQPVTRAEVDVVRGVQSAHHLNKLQERRLIREVGRRPGPGRPILYGTTEGFLRYFGLRDLTALPPLAGTLDQSIQRMVATASDGTTHPRVVGVVGEDDRPTSPPDSVG